MSKTLTLLSALWLAIGCQSSSPEVAVDTHATPTCRAEVVRTHADPPRCPPRQILCGGVCRYPHECDFWE